MLAKALTRRRIFFYLILCFEVVRGLITGPAKLLRRQTFPRLSVILAHSLRLLREWLRVAKYYRSGNPRICN